MSRGIILAAHGSRQPGAMAALAAFRAQVAAEHPDCRVELARTVGRKHGNAAAFGGARQVLDVLAELAAAGVTAVAVQSLHVVPGEEYHEMLGGLGRFLENGGQALSLSVGAPLLADLTDVDRVTGAILAAVPARRTAGHGVVVMVDPKPFAAAPAKPGAKAELAADAAKTKNVAGSGNVVRIVAEEKPGEYELRIQTNAPPASFSKAFMTDPPRMVLDLGGSWNYNGPLSSGTGNDFIRQIRVGKHPDKFRVVLDMAPDAPTRLRGAPTLERVSGGVVLKIPK